MLVIALFVAVGAYALVGLGTEKKVPADIFEYGGGLVAMAALCHVVVRLRAPYADPVLLPCAVALNGLGLAMIRRIDIARLADDSHSHLYATQQLVWTAVSVAGFVAALVFIPDHRRLQAFTYTAGLAGLVLLLLPLTPGLGVDINGARIWIRFAGFSFQPGEVAKICLAVFFAGYLVVKRDALALAGRRFLGIDLPRGRDLGPIVLDVVRQPGRARVPARPRLLAAVLRPFRRAALRRDRASELAVRRSSAVRRRGVLRLPGLRPRAGPGRRMAAPVQQPRRLLPDHPGPVRSCLGRHPRPRTRSGKSAADAVLVVGLHRDVAR